MTKTLKATKVHWAATPKVTHKALSKKRPELVVVKPGHPAPAADGGARKLQRVVQSAMRSAPKSARRARRTVEILSEQGGVLAAYSLVLERDSLDGEFEEAALILAENDGVAVAGIRARCRP